MNCPTCGLGRRRYYTMRHGRAVIMTEHAYTGSKWVRHTRPLVRPIRVAKAKYDVLHIPGIRGRTYAFCNDSFHDPKPVVITAPRGRVGHNPDLRQMKNDLSRALQGKDRR